MKLKLKNIEKLILIFALLGFIMLFILPNLNYIENSSFVCSGVSSANYYAFGYINWIFQRRWTGGSVSFDNPNPDYFTPNSSANHTIWLSTNNSTNSWVEAGYAKGESHNPDVRFLYWACGKYDENGNVYYYTSGKCLTPPGVPGKTHRYSILYYDDTGFVLYIDGYLEYIYNNELFYPYVKEIYIGLES